MGPGSRPGRRVERSVRRLKAGRFVERSVQIARAESYREGHLAALSSLRTQGPIATVLAVANKFSNSVCQQLPTRRMGPGSRPGRRVERSVRRSKPDGLLRG